MNDLRKKVDSLDRNLFGTVKYQNSLALLYHENSKLTSKKLEGLAVSIQNFNNSYINRRASNPFKVYPNASKISLEEYISRKPKSIDLYSAIQTRRSNKSFNGYKLSINELAQIFYYSYGISTIGKDVYDNHWKFRTVPSGGGLYPLELYIVLINSHLPLGLYHFRPDILSLELIKKGNFANSLDKICGTDSYDIDLNKVSGVIFTTFQIERSYIKYNERAYRFILLETGFVAQNQNLICENLGINSSMFGGYIDQKVNEFLEIDGIRETVQNTLVIGK